nr:adenosylhomocysteinase [bacterium]
ALKANLEGFRVMTMDEAAPLGDVFITATGMKDIIVDRHFKTMKDGAVVCNTGHYDCEINLGQLEEIAGEGDEIRPNNEVHSMPGGQRIYVLAKGRLVNLAAAEGHPSEVMDMSFANQFMSLLWMSREGKQMDPLVHDIPEVQDQDIAALKLKTLGIDIDSLTEEQIKYATDYSAGT